MQSWPMPCISREHGAFRLIRGTIRVPTNIFILNPALPVTTTKHHILLRYSDTEAAVFHAPSGDRDVMMMAKTFEKESRIEVSPTRPSTTQMSTQPCNQAGQLSKPPFRIAPQVQSIPGAYDAVLLPYKGGKFHALVALPAPGASLQQTMEALTVRGMDKVMTAEGEPASACCNAHAMSS